MVKPRVEKEPSLHKRSRIFLYNVQESGFIKFSANLYEKRFFFILQLFHLFQDDSNYNLFKKYILIEK
jgi:hypothetical protein